MGEGLRGKLQSCGTSVCSAAKRTARQVNWVTQRNAACLRNKWPELKIETLVVDVVAVAGT